MSPFPCGLAMAGPGFQAMGLSKRVLAPNHRETKGFLACIDHSLCVESHARPSTSII